MERRIGESLADVTVFAQRGPVVPQTVLSDFGRNVVRYRSADVGLNIARIDKDVGTGPVNLARDGHKRHDGHGQSRRMLAMVDGDAPLHGPRLFGGKRAGGPHDLILLDPADFGGASRSHLGNGVLHILETPCPFFHEFAIVDLLLDNDV